MLSLFEVVKHSDKVEEKSCHHYASPILGQFMFKVQNFHLNHPHTFHSHLLSLHLHRCHFLNALKVTI